MSAGGGRGLGGSCHRRLVEQVRLAQPGAPAPRLVEEHGADRLPHVALGGVDLGDRTLLGERLDDRLVHEVLGVPAVDDEQAGVGDQRGAPLTHHLVEHVPPVRHRSPFPSMPQRHRHAERWG
jgi:hypothetical protein